MKCLIFLMQFLYAGRKHVLKTTKRKLRPDVVTRVVFIAFLPVAGGVSLYVKIAPGPSLNPHHPSPAYGRSVYRPEVVLVPSNLRKWWRRRKWRKSWEITGNLTCTTSGKTTRARTDYDFCLKLECRGQLIGHGKKQRGIKYCDYTLIFCFSKLDHPWETGLSNSLDNYGVYQY